MSFLLASMRWPVTFVLLLGGILHVFAILALPQNATKTRHYQLCMNNSVCRDRYMQAASNVSGNMSPVRFAREISALSFKIDVMLGGGEHAARLSSSDRQSLYEMILQKTVLDEDRCPPNSYWYWEDASQRGTCRCYIDRDCRSFTTAVCQDTTHASVFVLGIIFAVLILIDIIVHIVTDRYTQ